MSFFSKVVLAWVAVLAGANGVIQLQPARAQPGDGQTSASSPPAPPAQPAAPIVGSSAGSPAAESPHRLLLRRYCTSCHSDRLKTAGLSLEALDLSKVGDAAETWEKVVWKLRGGIMPPVGRPRPDAASIDQFASYLESELDRAAAASPNPGRVPVHRLNRAEYANAIRDLLALEINGPALLPADEVGHGFDNIAGNLTLSPALLERYMSAARRISRLAIGDPSIGPGYTSKIYVVPINKTQNDRMSEDLPFGSRAGLAVRHHFPLDGEYHLRIKLKKSVYEYIVNLEEAHNLDVRLDGVRLQRFPIGGVQAGKPAPVSFSGTFMAAGGAGFPTQEWDDYLTSADAHLTLKVNVTGGTHLVAVSFVGKSWAPEGILQPPLREYGATVTEITDTSSKPEGPGLESITIDGPYNPAGPGQTAEPSADFQLPPVGRRRSLRPSNPDEPGAARIQAAGLQRRPRPDFRVLR